MMASDSERREVAENLRYLADYPGAPVRYAEQFRDELSAVVLPDGFTHDYSELIQRLADLIEPKGIESEAFKSVESGGFDREALLALAGILRTPEQDADCGACPLRKWCDTELYNGHRITCFECRTWHTADAILEACGERAS